MKKPSFVLDNFALLAYFQAEPKAMKVKGILKQARNKDVLVSLSLINLGEILYIVERKMGPEASR